MIEEIDYNKYIVIKTDDVNKYLNKVERQKLCSFLEFIDYKRKQLENKKSNKYLVLNIDDDFDVIELRKLIYNMNSMYEGKIKYIAVHIINSILKSKKK